MALPSRDLEIDSQRRMITHQDLIAATNNLMPSCGAP
jgi:hypothetical protein